MSFTVATITHLFVNADGTPASGAVEFALTKRMSQTGQTIVPGTLTANLNASGQLSQPLTANVDSGTIPQDAQWRATLRIIGDPQDTFFITVPSGGGTVDLFSLLPQEPNGG